MLEETPRERLAVGLPDTVVLLVGVDVRVVVPVAEEEGVAAGVRVPVGDTVPVGV